MTGHTLLLLRHGKSDSPAGVADFDRPLKKRGRQASDQIGRWLIDNGLTPDFMLSSPANRAITTARRVCETMGKNPGTIHEKRDIYLAELETLLKTVRLLPESADRAMIVGHNPGLEELLAALSKTVVSPYDESGRMPTCALAVLRLGSAWADTALQSASLEFLILPRALPPAA